MDRGWPGPDRDLYASTGALPPEAADELVTNNAGVQYLVQVLDLPHDRPISVVWQGLDV